MCTRKRDPRGSFSKLEAEQPEGLLALDDNVTLGVFDLLVQVSGPVDSLDQNVLSVNLSLVGVELNHLDNVVAVLCLNETRGLAGLQRKGGVFERLDHLSLAKEAQIAAIGSGGVLRVLLGQRSKVTAGVK